MRTWIEAEERFRGLGDPLRFLRLDIQWGSAGEHWHVTGMPRTNDVVQFELLAAVCGRLLESSLDKTDELGAEILAEKDARTRWYRALKELAGYEANFLAYEADERGNRTGAIHSACIPKVVEVSANLCLLLHVEYPVKDQRKLYEKIYDDYGKEIVIGSILALITTIVGIFFG